MGTRADFFIGAGKNAEWIGSVAWDGYEWANKKECDLVKSDTKNKFVDAVLDIFKDRDDVTLPVDGWPWPWDDSNLTDYTYYFKNGKVSWNDCDDWPDMSKIKNVQMGANKSGILLFKLITNE